MIPLLAVLAFGLVTGVLGATAVARHPERSADAPRLSSARLRRLVGRRHLAAVTVRHVEPAAATAVVLTAVFVLVVLTAAAIGIVLLLATSESVTGRTDAPLAAWAAEHSVPWSTAVLRALSRLGGTVAVVGLATGVAAVEYRRTRAAGTPILLALTVGGQFAVVNLTKAVVDRARPEVLQLTGFSGASFPSGHAAAAAASYACFAMLLGRGRSPAARAALAGSATAIAGWVAATRVALGVHWFTDVIGGLILGWGWFILCAVAVGGPALKFGAPVRTSRRLVGRGRRP